MDAIAATAAAPAAAAASDRPKKLLQLQKKLHQAHHTKPQVGNSSCSPPGKAKRDGGRTTSAGRNKKKRKRLHESKFVPHNGKHKKRGQGLEGGISSTNCKPTSGASTGTTVAESSGKRKGTKKKSKKRPRTKNRKKQPGGSENNNKAKPPGIVCVAEQSLVQRIQKRPADRSKGRIVDFPKDQISELPLVPYAKTKKIVVILGNTSANKAVAAIRSELQETPSILGAIDGSNNHVHCLGFDTETRPKFRKGGNKHPVALLQLATASTAYLFRLSYCGMDQIQNCMTESLRQLLADTSVIKVGVGVRSDLVALKEFHGPACCGDGTSFLDLAPLIRVRWPQIRRVGLRNLAATVLGWRLSKAQQMSNWELQKMTEAMENYAAADAFVALDLLGSIIG